MQDRRAGTVNSGELPSRRGRGERAGFARPGLQDDSRNLSAPQRVRADRRGRQEAVLVIGRSLLMLVSMDQDLGQFPRAVGFMAVPMPMLMKVRSCPSKPRRHRSGEEQKGDREWLPYTHAGIVAQQEREVKRKKPPHPPRGPSPPRPLRRSGGQSGAVEPRRLNEPRAGFPFPAHFHLQSSMTDQEKSALHTITPPRITPAFWEDYPVSRETFLDYLTEPPANAALRILARGRYSDRNEGRPRRPLRERGARPRNRLRRRASRRLTAIQVATGTRRETVARAGSD